MWFLIGGIILHNSVKVLRAMARFAWVVLVVQ
jgi:hypothetical protein